MLDTTNSISISTDSSTLSAGSLSAFSIQPMPTKRVNLKGGMTTSKRPGNGLMFDAEALALLASDKPNAPYVIDHGMAMQDIAGLVKKVTATRGEMEIDIVAGPKKGQKKKMPWTTLTHESILLEDLPSYTQALSVIKAIMDAGETPQESIALQAEGINYDDETDLLFLSGPYRLVHHSLVSRGAFGPEDGIGIQTAEFSATPTTFSYEERAISGETNLGLLVTNMPDLVAAFGIEYANNPLAIRAAMKAGIGIENSDFATETIKKTINTPSGLHGNKGNQMPDSDTPAIAAPDIQKLLEAAVAPLKTQLDAIANERKAADSTRLATEKARLLSEYAGLIDEEGVNSATSVEALVPLERMARKFQTQNPGTRKTQATPPTSMQATIAKKSEEHRQDWMADLANMSAINGQGSIARIVRGA